MDALPGFARKGLHLLFWPWNVFLCAVAIFGYVPNVLKDQVFDALDGLARWDFVIGSVVLCVVPLATTAYAFFHLDRYKEHPLELAELFFGVELPLLAITAARLFGFHQLSNAAQFVYVALVAGGVVAEGRLVLGERFPKGQFFDGLAHGILTLRFVAGSYVGFLLANLTIPLILNAVAAVVVDGVAPVGVVIAAVVLFPVTLFVAATALLVLTLPITAPLSWFHALKESGAEVKKKWGVDDLLFTTGSPVVVAVIGFALLVPQPHVTAISSLLSPPKDDAERRALVDDRDNIEAGLVDAWLAEHTYVADDTNTVWSRLWSLEDRWIHRRELGEMDANLNAAARPFTYFGFGVDADRAASLYRAFFGRDIARDHADRARAALAATWSREDRFAGFINEGQQRVRLDEQRVTAVVKEAGSGVVDVEIHDTWVNQTTNDEEVALYFELPESAAVTGLWVSPTSNKSDGAMFTVSPRGAAQQMYAEEVKAGREPALLEEIGPRQYRLKVFPVPARAPRLHDVMSAEAWAGPDASALHVWMSYQTLPTSTGGVPFPVLRERRNGFWDSDTVRVVNGVDASATDAVEGGGWVQGEAVVDANEANVVVGADFGPNFGGGGGGCVRLRPWAAPAVDLKGKTVDVVVDRSLAVADHKDALKRALQKVRATGATLRFVLGTSSLRGEGASAVDHFDDADVDAAVFFGAAQPKNLLQQLIKVRDGKLGDAVVVLAGAASFDTADDSVLDLSLLPAPKDTGNKDAKKLPPTLLVHLGEMPRGYDDATLDALRRSGGTATDDVDTALARLSPITFVDGRRVDATAEECPRSRAGLPMAARQAILLADRGGLAPLEDLDRLHHIAVGAAVVTPYSSMIVLLDDTAMARLRQLNAGSDRYNRELENQKRNTDDSGLFAKVKSAVAEPPPPPPAVAEAMVVPTAPTSPPPPPVDTPAEEPALRNRNALADALANIPSVAERSDTSTQSVRMPQKQLQAAKEQAKRLAIEKAKAEARVEGKVMARQATAAKKDSVDVRDGAALGRVDADRGAGGVAIGGAASTEGVGDEFVGDKKGLAPLTKTRPSAPTSTSDPVLDFRDRAPAPTAPTPEQPQQPQKAQQERGQSVSGVPEPHEWLLLIVGGVAVVVLGRRRRSLF